jgi:hypothetical protein
MKIWWNLESFYLEQKQKNKYFLYSLEQKQKNKYKLIYNINYILFKRMKDL